ncbi:MAG TPA: hypothetical protein VLM89_09280 [Phycisphaerae bacterium]|nr:hypothetical protein [Phycisphaerae bacterium]
MAQPLMLIEFSLDIGSDTELSDPQTNGNEAFDPGDVYTWIGPPNPPPGVNGFKDDGLRIFGLDPIPVPGILPPSRVPVGQVTSPPNPWQQFYPLYFDLDGHDQTDQPIEQFIEPGGTMPQPIPRFPSACIHEARFLLVSFDDDMAPGWISPLIDVPVIAFSPAGVIYGTTAGRDEVVGVDTVIQAPPPLPVIRQYPFLDEIGLHQSLAPNPDWGNPKDDDCDSLDAVRSEAACPLWYFTADQEANFGLDPGHIYRATGGVIPPQLVVNKVIHLGLSPDTDIDAFEFVWLHGPAGPMPGQYLGILFSVDDDDPVTVGVDESGGLNPNMIYASYCTGFSFPFLTQPLQGDVDAITAWEASQGPPDLKPPVVVSAVSRRTHGLVGPLTINVLTPSGTCNVAVEDRAGGPRELRVWFDELIFGVGGLDPSDVTIVDTAGSSIVINSVTINNTELTILFTGVADVTRVRVRFPGIMDAWGNICTDTFCFGVLKGDATGDCRVNSFDMINVRARLNQPVTQALVRQDVQPSGGVINSFDLIAVRSNLNRVLPPLNPP